MEKYNEYFRGIDNAIKESKITPEEFKKNKNLFILMNKLGFWHSVDDDFCLHYFAKTYIVSLKTYVYVLLEKGVYNVYVKSHLMKNSEKHEHYVHAKIGSFSNEHELLSLWSKLIFAEIPEINYLCYKDEEDELFEAKKEIELLKKKISFMEKAKHIQECQKIIKSNK